MGRRAVNEKVTASNNHLMEAVKKYEKQLLVNKIRAKAQVGTNTGWNKYEMILAKFCFIIKLKTTFKLQELDE